MTILNPDHLFEQADRLVASPPAGPPRQVDLRRAISSAYYGLFHFILIAMADEFVGVTQRATPRYALFYRNVDHRALRDLCSEARKQTPATKYIPFIPAGGFCQEIQDFAVALIELQEQRHLADYDPTRRFRSSAVQLLLGTGRTAKSRFDASVADHRRMFLTLLAAPPR